MTEIHTSPLRDINPRAKLDDALAANGQQRLAGYWLHELNETMVQVSVDLTWPSLVKLIQNLQKEPLTLPSGWHLERVDPHHFHERAVALRHSDEPGGYAVAFRPGNRSWNYQGGIDRLSCHAFSDGGAPPGFASDAPSLPHLLEACIASGQWRPGRVFQVEPSFDPESPHEFRRAPHIRGGRVADGFLSATTVLGVLGEALHATDLAAEAQARAADLSKLSYSHVSVERAATVEAACGAVAADGGFLGAICREVLESYAMRALAVDFGRRWTADPGLNDLLASRGAGAKATAFDGDDST